MNGYNNLTERQKELLRKLVRYIREGKSEEPIVPVGTDQGYFIPLRGGGSLEHQGDLIGDLNVLCDSDLMSFRWEKGNKLYSIKKAGYDAVDAQEKAKVQCSFCRRAQDEVNRLIAGPDNSFICDDCVELCVEILDLPRSSKIDLEQLGFKPRFKKLQFEQRPNHCFYLCPFKEPFNTIYQDHVLRALDSEGFTVERADEIYGTQPIIEDIWEGICSATLVIADVTGRNPNVMYEVGMAHTVGKPVLIITQNINDVPFDLIHYRCIIYDYTPRGCRELEEKITGTVRTLKKGLSKRP